MARKLPSKPPFQYQRIIHDPKSNILTQTSIQTLRFQIPPKAKRGTTDTRKMSQKTEEKTEESTNTFKGSSNTQEPLNGSSTMPQPHNKNTQTSPDLFDTIGHPIFNLICFSLFCYLILLPVMYLVGIVPTGWGLILNVLWIGGVMALVGVEVW